ncbi:MAG: cytochrome c [Capnocytophaga sp.]|nr:cytochrome c [Capnocytophaga sp.]
MKRTILTIAMISFIFASCGDNSKKKQADTPVSQTSQPVAEQPTNKPINTANPENFMDNKGIGPVKSVTLAEKIDEAMAKKGEEHFKSLCVACHRPDKKFIGPAPKGILERRSPEWVMNMIMNPEEMIQKDPIAMQLLKEANGAPMANQNVSEQHAREILEYFRTIK